MRHHGHFNRFRGHSGVLTQLSPEVGLRLAELPCELVWATTGEDEACRATFS